MKTSSDQREQDYNLLIKDKRHSLRNYGAATVKAGFDMKELVKKRQLPLSQDVLYDGIRAVGDYCVERKIGNIVLVDKSARPLWTGLSEYWKQVHPDQERPGLHFINPTLYRRTIDGAGSPDELQSLIGQAAEATIKQMSDPDSKLKEQSDQPLMLFDACLHTGRAVHLTKRVLEAAGFTDMHVGVIRTTLAAHHPLSPDVSGSDNIVAARCFRAKPGSSAVVNDDTSIYSRISGGGSAVPAAAERHAIRTRVSEGIARDRAAA